MFSDFREPNQRPMVAATICGRRYTMLVDTGASEHFLAQRLAPAQARCDQEYAVGFDYTGRKIRGCRVPGAGLAIDGLRPPPEGDLFISPWIDDFQRAGFALDFNEPHFDGLISPQRLASGGDVVVLDLYHGRMSIGSWSDAERMLRDGDQALVAGEIESTRDLKFVVPAVVAGRAFRLAIDTGAPRSLLYVRRSDDLPRSATRERSRYAEIQAGETTTSVKLQLLEALPELADQETDGLLGMDVLHSCILAFDTARLRARCVSGPAGMSGRGSPVFEARPLDARGRGWEGRGLVKLSDAGPAMRPLANGSFEWMGEGVRAVVLRDGSVTITKLPPRPSPIRMREDGRNETEWFYDVTLEARTELARIDDLRRIRDALDGLPRYLTQVWRATGLSPAVRRRLLFALWDEAAEPDDPERGWAGARARRIIERFVRTQLPLGSADAFSADEMRVLNAQRRRHPTFSPYDPPPPEEYGQDRLQ